MALPKRKAATWRDFDLANFGKPHPISGDCIVLTDARAIMQAIRNLIYTNEEEFLMEPTIYGGVEQDLFSLNTSMLAYNIKKRITDLIVTYEPRVDLTDVTVSISSPHELDIAISFFFNNQPQPITDVITLTRLR